MRKGLIKLINPPRDTRVVVDGRSQPVAGPPGEDPQRRPDRLVPVRPLQQTVDHLAGAGDTASVKGQTACCEV
ncbi:hypothetical protein EYF80_020327 [Liparis tanakae]|uniref:Uncharacterized protein n=1 Tax=Liparis tanakae TaxID=230148 RepID=A0A4Z2HWX6_9TELE|nr:hypothetical protein EYF80_020327 [Liparis tanakae]